MEKIPVTFTFNNKSHSGFLQKVSGAGTSGTYHLMINNFYQGQLNKTDKGWQFYSQDGKGNELSEYFGKCVEENKT